MTTARSDSLARVTLAAGDSLFGAGIAHAMMTGSDKVNHVFPALFARLEQVRSGWGWSPTQQRVFVAAVDLNSDRQGGLLQKASEAGALVDAVDYRDYYPGPPPGGSIWTSTVTGKPVSDTQEEAGSDGPARPRPTLSPRLNFLMGGIAAKLRPSTASREERAEVLVVAHHFELKDSLLELARRGARVGIAFYRSLMEPRWERVGLYDERSPIKFHDLGQHLDEVTTLGQRRPSVVGAAGRSTISQLF